MIRVTNEPSLFGDDDPAAAMPVNLGPTPPAAWLLDLIRKELDAQGLTDMADRQRVVIAAAGRSVESLRDLTQDEVTRVLNHLGEARSKRREVTSLWDERDEATWIDQL